MDAIGKVDVQLTWRAEHDRRTRGWSPVRVARRVVCPHVSLDLDEPPNTAVGADQQLPDQGSAHITRVPSEEIAGKRGGRDQPLTDGPGREYPGSWSPPALAWSPCYGAGRHHLGLTSAAAAVAARSRQLRDPKAVGVRTENG